MVQACTSAIISGITAYSCRDDSPAVVSRVPHVSAPYGSLSLGASKSGQRVTTQLNVSLMLRRFECVNIQASPNSTLSTSICFSWNHSFRWHAARLAHLSDFQGCGAWIIGDIVDQPK